jgi:hypothetical protein
MDEKMLTPILPIQSSNNHQIRGKILKKIWLSSYLVVQHQIRYYSPQSLNVGGRAYE